VVRQRDWWDAGDQPGRMPRPVDKVGDPWLNLRLPIPGAVATRAKMDVLIVHTTG
jgi:hypothetical protein